jgi:hypothetical protein
MKFLLALSLAFVATNADQSEKPTIAKENEHISTS